MGPGPRPPPPPVGELLRRALPRSPPLPLPLLREPAEPGRWAEPGRPRLLLAPMVRPPTDSSRAIEPCKPRHTTHHTLATYATSNTPHKHDSRTRTSCPQQQPPGPALLAAPPRHKHTPARRAAVHPTPAPTDLHHVPRPLALVLLAASTARLVTHGRVRQLRARRLPRLAVAALVVLVLVVLLRQVRKVGGGIGAQGRRLGAFKGRKREEAQRTQRSRTVERLPTRPQRFTHAPSHHAVRVRVRVGA
jgi:hypothetical protein